MPRYSDAEIIRALRESRGMVYVAADRLGCSPATVKKRMEKSVRVKQAGEDARERMKDRAETRLAEAIEHGEPWSIQFYLRTQGKDRGYGETTKHELANSDGEPFRFTLTIDKPNND